MFFRLGVMLTGSLSLYAGFPKVVVSLKGYWVVSALSEELSGRKALRNINIMVTAVTIWKGDFTESDLPICTSTLKSAMFYTCASYI
jgi:hypothetical protein